MDVLALEPYYGGSHKAFLEGWGRRSRHRWVVLSLPAHKWKWRMRHAAITFADQVGARVEKGFRWDVLFCSDMLNLAEFLGLAPASVARLPRVAYFHENQLTYPVRHEDERDFQFAITNLTTALAATSVWFNSAYHRDSFLTALRSLVVRMPDYQPLDALQRIGEKGRIAPPGIDGFPPRGTRVPGPLRILWAGRWEHDKNPEAFFRALGILKSKGLSFRLSVIGERFRESPSVFEEARGAFASEIDTWGFQDSPEEYRATLTRADVAVSTALHEFFGIGMVEAAAAGAYPLLPRRLSYPEIFGTIGCDDPIGHFYDGTEEDLTVKLERLLERCEKGDLWAGDPTRVSREMDRYRWDVLVPELDAALEAVGGTASGPLSPPEGLGSPE